MQIQTKTLDEKDLRIINALYKYGFGSSSRFLSKKINIPDRTISYRLKTLKDTGLLRIYPFMNERRLGLGDCCIVIQESETCKSSQISKLLEKIPFFYLISSTYGRYNGILCFSVYSLDSTHPKEFLEKLRTEELISDFEIYEICDHITSDPKLDYYDPHTGKWRWDWKQWEKEIETTLVQEHSTDLFANLHLEQKQTVINFDEIDIKLLKIKKDAFHNKKVILTNSELGKKLNLSAFKVRNRVQLLYDQGVIKGPLINFFCPEERDIHFIYLFVKMKDFQQSSLVISSICKLPFQVGIFVESKTKFILYYRMRTEEFSEFLQSFDLLKDYLQSYFFQIVPFYYNNRHHLYNAYNENTKSWDTPIEEYYNLIENFKNTKKS
ncbi:MAG: AsnC family transcriptional regulator [Candidatus Heimdallarchaeota archaeon]|nr:MAG: AsnC family transcriptional regulator [Candidatus Heimdallarchaeota archaeon]